MELIVLRHVVTTNLGINFFVQKHVLTVKYHEVNINISNTNTNIVVAT